LPLDFGLMPSVTGGFSLFSGFPGINDGRSCSASLHMVHSARTVSLLSLPGLLASKTPVI